MYNYTLYYNYINGKEGKKLSSIVYVTKYSEGREASGLYTRSYVFNT